MLNKRRRFSFKRGVPKRVFMSRFFVLRYQKKTLLEAHYSVVVGKRVDKKAVVRNKVKRQLMENLEMLLEDGQIDFDIVIYGRKEILNATKEESLDEFKKALEKIR